MQPETECLICGEIKVIPTACCNASANEFEKTLMHDLHSLREENARLRDACEYALGCLDGTIRDYKDRLPAKLREALQKASKP